MQFNLSKFGNISQAWSIPDNNFFFFEKVVYSQRGLLWRERNYVYMFINFFNDSAFDFLYKEPMSHVSSNRAK